MTPQSCERCGESGIVIHDRKTADMICGKCGNVLISRMIDPGAEWNDDFEEGSLENSHSRVSNIDAKLGISATFFLGGTEAQRRVMEQSQMRSLTEAQRRLLKGIEIVEEMVTFLHATESIKEDAEALFAATAELNLPDTKNNKYVAAACLYLACRQQGYPRTFDELSTALDVEVTTISRVQSAIARALNLQLQPIRPSALIARIRNQVHLNHHVIDCARQLCDNVSQHTDGVRPQIIATVAIIYASILCHERLDMQALLHASHLVASSIQPFYADMWNILHLVIPTSFQSNCMIRDIPATIDKATMMKVSTGSVLPAISTTIPSSISTSSRCQDSLSYAEEASQSPGSVYSNVGSATPRSDTSGSGSSRDLSKKRPKPQLFTATIASNQQDYMHRKKQR